MRYTTWVLAIMTAACGVTSNPSNGHKPVVSPPDDTEPGTPGSTGTEPIVALKKSVSIGDITINQAVSIKLVVDGAPASPKAPVIAGRPALARVGLRLSDGWKAKSLAAELHITTGAKEVAVLKDSKQIAGSAADGDLTSTFNFKLDASALTADSAYSVVVRDPSMPADQVESSIKFPEDGSSLKFGPQTGSGALKIKLVPVQYTPATTGTGTPTTFAPDLTAAQIKRYHDTLYKMYPTADVKLSVRKPLPWTTKIGPDGTGWEELITGIMDLRATDNEADDVFYVGVFVATRTIREFCARGCVLGVAQLARPTDVDGRMAVITGYTEGQFGQVSANTLNQELGHSLGREHAPCADPGQQMPDAIDTSFPYKNGGVGVWGYDFLDDKLVDPASGVRDFMGYCSKIWISDYTYQALFERIAYVDQPSTTMPLQNFRAIHVDANGSMRWGREVMLRSADVGETREVTLLGQDGAELRHVSARSYRRDNLPGETLYVPVFNNDVERVRVRFGGIASELVRSTALP